MPTEVLKKVRNGELEPWWCLDKYFVAHLAEQLTKLRDEGHGMPLRFGNEDHDPAAWNEYLTSIIERLEAYEVDDPIVYANTQAALHEFVANLTDFWD